MGKTRGKITKVISIVVSTALVIGMVPLDSAKVLAEEVKKAYEVIMEPTLVYEYVYGYVGDFIKVANSQTDEYGDEYAVWGATDKQGNEVIPCQYKELSVLDGENILVKDVDGIWHMLDERGNVICTYGVYYDMWKTDENKLYCTVIEEERDGYRILNFDGEILEEVWYNYGDDDYEDEEETIQYTGETEYDDVKLLRDEEHFLARNYGDNDNFEGWLIEADGTVIAELGLIQSYEDYYTVLEIGALDASTSEWYVYYINMEGKVEIIDDGYDSAHGSYGSSGGYYAFEYDTKYIRYEFPSLEKTTIHFSYTVDEIYDDVYDEKIYIKDTDNKWYCYDFEGKLLYNMNLPADVNSLQELENERLWAGAGDDKIYLTDIYGNVIQTYNYDMSEGYRLVYRNDYIFMKVYTSEEGGIGDLIDLQTGNVIYKNIDFRSFDIHKIDEKYLVCYDNIWSLVDNNFKVVKELGEYNYIDYDDINGEYSDELYAYKYDEDYYLEKVAIYDYNGTLLAEGTDYTYVNENVVIKNKDGYWNLLNENWEAVVEYGKYNELFTYCRGKLLIASENVEYDNVFYRAKYQNFTLLQLNGDVILNQGEIQDIGAIDSDGYLPIKINDKWGICKINADDSEIPSKPVDKNEQQENQNNNDGSNVNTTTNGNSSTAENTSATTKDGETAAQNIMTDTNSIVTSTVSAPAKAKIKKVKAAKKKVTLTLNKVKKAKGYLIQYSTKKNFKGAKSKYTTKTKITIKKLKSNKKYYFRVKAYKLDGKKKVFSKKWSKVKKVKVK